MSNVSEQTGTALRVVLNICLVRKGTRVLFKYVAPRVALLRPLWWQNTRVPTVLSYGSINASVSRQQRAPSSPKEGGALRELWFSFK